MGVVVAEHVTLRWIHAMKMKLCLLLPLCLLAVSCSAVPSLPTLLKGVDGGSIWVLLVAGSNTWMNYRHQVEMLT